MKMARRAAGVGQRDLFAHRQWRRPHLARDAGEIGRKERGPFKSPRDLRICIPGAIKKGPVAPQAANAEQ